MSYHYRNSNPGPSNPYESLYTDYANPAPFILRRKINFQNLLMRISHFINYKNVDLGAGYSKNMAAVYKQLTLTYM
jgi:hypothetical protein